VTQGYLRSPNAEAHYAAANPPSFSEPSSSQGNHPAPIEAHYVSQAMIHPEYRGFSAAMLLAIASKARTGLVFPYTLRIVSLIPNPLPVVTLAF